SHQRADAVSLVGTVFDVSLLQDCFGFIDNYYEGASFGVLQHEPHISISITLGQRLKLPTGGILKHVAVVPVEILFQAPLSARWIGFDERQQDQHAASPRPEASWPGACYDRVHDCIKLSEIARLTTRPESSSEAIKSFRRSLARFRENR